MNRNDRNRIRKAARLYLANCIQASSEFGEELQMAISKEEEKLGNLPENLQDSRKGQDIEQCIEMLGEALDAMENAEDAFDEIAGILSVEAQHPLAATRPGSIDANGRSVDFHAVLPKQLAGQLRSKSILSGLSMNEIICRSLMTYISSDQ